MFSLSIHLDGPFVYLCHAFSCCFFFSFRISEWFSSRRNVSLFLIRNEKKTLNCLYDEKRVNVYSEKEEINKWKSKKSKKNILIHIHSIYYTQVVYTQVSVVDFYAIMLLQFSFFLISSSLHSSSVCIAFNAGICQWKTHNHIVHQRVASYICNHMKFKHNHNNHLTSPGQYNQINKIKKTAPQNIQQTAKTTGRWEKCSS